MQRECDLVIVGGGPAGLSAAVSAAADGLSVILIDGANQLGGQARESSKIENYPGFPGGISGPDLMTKMVTQANDFKVEFHGMTRAAELLVDGNRRCIITDGGDEFCCKSALLALGVQYRRLEAKGISRLMGRGVRHGPPDMDARIVDTHVVVVGGANSAGQAAMHFADCPGCHVSLVVRGNDLNTKMSDYLVGRIEKNSKIDVLLNTEVKEVFDGKSGQLERVGLSSGKEIDAGKLFVFIGAQPYTRWLNGSVLHTGNQKKPGFILTDTNVSCAPKDGRPILPYETSQEGIFAAGDVRFGSTRRVSSAVGQGSMVVEQVHKYMATLA